MTDTIFLKTANRAAGTLASGITDVAVSLTLQAGEGAEFPSTFPFHVTSDDEILKVEARAGDVLSSLSRGEEGTTPAAHIAGANVRLHITAEAMTEIHDAVNALELEDVKRHSAGWYTGGVISDAGGETIDVTAGTGVIRTSASAIAPLILLSWSVSNGLAIPTNTVRYIGVEYNAGSPQVTVRTSNNFNHFTDFELGIVINEGGTLHIQQHEWHAGDISHGLIERFHQTNHIERDNELAGNILGESADTNRYVEVSAGAFWTALDRFATAAIDTNPGGGADTFDTYSASGPEAVGATQWPNAQYDNAGTLTNMTGNRWANLWFFEELDGEVIMVYGTAQYTREDQAEDEDVPAVLPARATVHGKLIGRIIFQRLATTAAQVQSAFAQVFEGTAEIQAAERSFVFFMGGA